MKQISRRDFLKFSAVALATAAATQIPVNIPYKLPYWRDLLRDGETHNIVFRWGPGYQDLTVDGVACDPGNDFCVREDGFVDYLVVSTKMFDDKDSGTIVFDFTPRDGFASASMDMPAAS